MPEGEHRFLQKLLSSAIELQGSSILHLLSEPTHTWTLGYDSTALILKAANLAARQVLSLKFKVRTEMNSPQGAIILGLFSQGHEKPASQAL